MTVRKIKPEHERLIVPFFDNQKKQKSKKRIFKIMHNQITKNPIVVAEVECKKIAYEIKNDLVKKGYDCFVEVV